MCIWIESCMCARWHEPYPYPCSCARACRMQSCYTHKPAERRSDFHLCLFKSQSKDPCVRATSPSIWGESIVSLSQVATLYHGNRQHFVYKICVCDVCASVCSKCQANNIYIHTWNICASSSRRFNTWFVCSGTRVRKTIKRDRTRDQRSRDTVHGTRLIREWPVRWKYNRTVKILSLPRSIVCRLAHFNRMWTLDIPRQEGTIVHCYLLSSK